VWIALVKNSSIASAFAVFELVAFLTRLSSQSAGVLVVVGIGVTLGYLIITLPSGYLVSYFERRLAVRR
jgi:glutamate transport system permease protein